MAVKQKRIYGEGTRPLTVTVTDEQRAVLIELGNGNASEGLRRLIKLHNDEVAK